MNAAWTKYLPHLFRRRLEGRHNLQKIISNTGWLLMDKVVRMGVGLIVGVWIARYLGPEQFGILNYATAFVALFATIATLGLDGIAVRDIVREPGNKNDILGTVFILRLTGGLATLFFTSVTIYALRSADALTRWLVAIIAAGTVFQAFDVIDYWFQSQVQSRYTVVAKNAAFLLTALLKVFLLFVKAPLMAFAFAGLIEIILGATGLVIAYRSRGQFLISWRWNPSWAKRLLKDSWPLILSGMVIMVYMKIDQVMLGIMIGDRAVGIYSAAVRISEVWYFIPTIVASSVYPALIKAYHLSERNFYEKLQTIMGYFFWGNLLLSLIIASLSSKLVALLYGPSFSDSTAVLEIHIYSGIIVSMSIIFSVKYIIDGTTKINFYGAFSGAITNVVLNLWLIKTLGPKGAAIATLISYAVPIVVLSVLFDKRIGIAFIEAIVSPIRRMKDVS